MHDAGLPLYAVQRKLKHRRRAKATGCWEVTEGEGLDGGLTIPTSIPGSDSDG